ncbi:MAG: LysR family transcriptional regulator [Hyphomicrobium sp.]|uniref:LysR family transcriptional regulator n=1 Tax=Hyphomicrobium sp. TaxID=82 RepID=UPI0039E70635
MSTRSNRLPFDLHALEAFLGVCDSRSMALAAKKLSLTQPAVSQAVADLESRMGVKLFDRGVRPLALTPAGEIMRQRASALLSEARQIATVIRHTARGRLALVRVGLVDSLSRALTGPVASFLANHADHVSVQSGLTAAHAGALLTRNLDLFIGVDDMSDVEGFDRHELITEPYILLLPSRAKIPRSVADLASCAERLPFIRYSARSKTGIDIERYLRRLNIDFPQGLEFDTPFGVTDMVARGKGFAISTPICIAEAALENRDLRAAPLPGPSLKRTLTLVSRRFELGTLPRELTKACKSSLDTTTLPALRTSLPWLSGELQV